MDRLVPASCSARSSYTRQFCISSGCAPATHTILFYAYRHVAEPEEAADAHVQLCASLQLSGRVLLATEGINGMLSGTVDAVERYIAVLCTHPIFQMCASDFKHSRAQGAADAFSRELFVLVVAEIVASGGVLQSIPLAETGSGYLSPAEWREAVLAADENTVIIDVRSAPHAPTSNTAAPCTRDNVGSPPTSSLSTSMQNAILQVQHATFPCNLLLQQVRNRREFALGRFKGAIDPRTRSFAEFPAWCSAQSELLRDKKVLMYCTGGVRCEKASAFIRATGVAKEVHHLRGGIHRYTETFGEDESLWMGTNFVFDRRAALEGPPAVSELAAPPALKPKHIVVGRCVGCDAPWELMDGAAVCTVCNEPVLACDDCRALRDEHHCDEHSHLRHCFFRQLCPFSEPQLVSQLAALTEKRRDKRLSRPARRTIGLHAQRVEQRLCSLQAGEAIAHAVLAEPTVEAWVTLWVTGRFPGCKPEARLAWPCRIWPLSARPWAFIREVNCAAVADAPRFGVEVDCKISADQYDTELGLRLAPHGRHARTRIWSVRWDGPRNATLVACALQQAVSADVAEQDSQRKLHLRWLGFELLGSNPPELDGTPGK